MIMIGTPVIMGKTSLSPDGKKAVIGEEDISERTQYMTTAKNILVAGGDAAERLMSSYKEVKKKFTNLTIIVFIFIFIFF